MVKDKDFIEIVLLGQQEKREAESHLGRGKAAIVKARQSGLGYYIESLGRFLFFMQNGIKPWHVDENEFRLYKIVCKKLVEKGQLKKEVLDFFK